MYKRSAFYFSLVLIVSIIGFFPSYFSVLLKTDAIHHFHGFMATLWMLLLILQAWLVQNRNFSTHRIIGWVSLGIVPLFLFSGLLVIMTMLRGKGAFSQAFGARLALVDLISLIYFAFCYCSAIAYRKNLRIHARFFASTALLVLPPALARFIPMLFPFVHSFGMAFHLSYFFSEFIVVLLILDDRRIGKILFPYPMLLTVMLVQQIGFMFITQLRWWNVFASWLGSHA